MFATALELERCGLFPISLSRAHRRPPTRIEMAVSIHQCVMKIGGELDIRLKEPTPGNIINFYVPRQVALTRLERMATGFSKELEGMGVDLKKFGRKVHAAQRKASDLRELAPKKVIGLSRKPMPDIPENHWIYAAIEDLKRLGAVKPTDSKRFQDRMNQRGPWTGLDFAEPLAKGIKRLNLALDQELAKRSKTTRQDYDYILSVPRLIDYLRPELETRREDLRALLAEAEKAVKRVSALPASG